MPSMPTMLSKVEDRLPEVLERAASTLQTLREIIARVPATLDRSERFFTNIERVLHDSEIPALSAESRKFLSTTNTQLAQLAQMERITSELNRLIESQEAFARFIDDTRATINAADLPATTRSARDSADRTSLAADDLRRSLPAMRDSLEELRQLARFLGSTGIRYLWSTSCRGEDQMIVRSGRGPVSFWLLAYLVRAGLLAATSRLISARMIEPQLAEPSVPGKLLPTALPVRLLETQARGHIGRRLLHQQSNGELTEDHVWRWASTPDRYLDAALRAELASNSEVRLVDAGMLPRWLQRCSSGISSLRGRRASSGLSNSKS